MIRTGSWKELKFKSYNLDAEGKHPLSGNLHPLLNVREQFKEVLLSMGFEEMQTNRYVESSFWNFDALFQPQRHPARDAHDTFFVSDPKESKVYDNDLWKRVKEMHEVGGHGSLGYQCEWEEKEAKSLIFRTHTTAITSQTLYKYAQEIKEKGF